MNTNWIRSSVTLLVLALCGTMAAAQTTLIPPTIRIAPLGVEYMCGGAAKDDSAFMRMVASRWAATFEFAINDKGRRALPVAARVRVRNPHNGDVVLDVPSAGPMMLARLEPGSYEVDVTLGELTLTQSINVEIGQPAHAVFLWPSNFDMAGVVPRGGGETTALLSTGE